MSKDVSAGGAFFPTDKTIPKDTKVKLRLTLSSETVKELTDTQGFLLIEGNSGANRPKWYRNLF